jgi:hypothetical protein
MKCAKCCASPPLPAMAIRRIAMSSKLILCTFTETILRNVAISSFSIVKRAFFRSCFDSLTHTQA